MKGFSRGQTLAEVLVVVAALGILGAVAIARYETSNVRSQTAEARAVLASAAHGIEAYYIDNGIFPYDGYSVTGPGLSGFNYWYPPRMLSTPVAYVESADIQDPFRTTPNTELHWQFDNIRYISTGSTWGADWTEISGKFQISSFYDEVLEDVGGYRISSAGPDGSYGPSNPAWQTGSGYPSYPIPYDPTNGTTSPGDIIRSQKHERGYPNI